MKYVIRGIKILDGVSMATSQSSAIENDSDSNNSVSFLDNIGFQFVWTGTPTGVITVSSSIDGVNFDDLTFDPEITQPAGSSGHSSANVNQFPFKWIKVTYTRTSGTGSLTVWMSGKAI